MSSTGHGTGPSVEAVVPASMMSRSSRCGASPRFSTAAPAAAATASRHGSSSGAAASSSSSSTATSSAFAKGSSVWYEKRGELTRATVDAVHFDDGVPYYTVRLASGDVRETTGDFLQEHLRKPQVALPTPSSRTLGPLGAMLSAAWRSRAGKPAPSGPRGASAQAAAVAAAAPPAPVSAPAARAAPPPQANDDDEVKVVRTCSKQEKEKRLRQEAIDLDEDEPPAPKRARTGPAATCGSAGGASSAADAGSSPGLRTVAGLADLVHTLNASVERAALQWCIANDVDDTRQIVRAGEATIDQFVAATGVKSGGVKETILRANLKRLAAEVM